MAYSDPDRAKAVAAAWYKTHRERAKASRIKWQKAHPDQMKTIKATYRKTHKDKLKTSNAEYYKTHKKQIASTNKAWREAHPEKVKAARIAWENANPGQMKIMRDIWAKDHPENARIRCRNRRAAKKNSGGKLSSGIISILFPLQKGKCAICKKSLKKTGLHIDHILPLIRGGKNTDNNVQLTCPTCNCRKGGKDPIQFMQEMGFLL